METGAEKMSVAELEKMLKSRRTQLDTLLKEREKLGKQLGIVEERIKEVEGGLIASGHHARKGGSTAATRAMNAKSLHTHVTEILEKADDGLTLSGLADAVIDRGYKTHSTNFKNVLYQCLYNSKKVKHDSDTGTYKLV